MDNTYNIDFIARCIAGHNKADIKSIITELENVQKQVGGVSLVEITQEDYDALTDKDPSTIYLVSNGDKITLYIGGTEVNVQSDWTQTITTADDYIKNKPTLGTAAAKNATDTYNATGTDVTTGKAVAAALATLPEPMVFKGSLGTGGTITTLPTASSSNKGYVYKVITAGIYANLSAKVGDTFISDGSTWVLIPSGDEPSGTVTNVAVANGGGLTVSGSPITTSGTITVGHSNSVTAKTSSSLKKFSYDAYGHVTGSSELSTDESNALASGIDSTKVAQITTNKNNISFVQDSNGIKNLLDCSLATLKADRYNTGGTFSFSWSGNVCTTPCGVTFTINADNSIDVVATSVTADVWFRLKQNFQYGVDSYVISGCPSGGSTSTYFLESDNLNARDTGSSVVIERNSAYTDNIFLVVKVGTTFTGTFKPMICTKKAWDISHSYAPHALSNAELTDNVSIIDILSTVTTESGYTVTENRSWLRKQGKHVFGMLLMQKSTAYSPTLGTAATVAYKPEKSIVLGTFLSSDGWGVSEVGYAFIHPTTGAMSLKANSSYSGSDTYMMIPIDYMIS